MTTVRCSSLPLVSACAASAVAPAVDIQSPRAPSDAGTAFHDCMAAYVQGIPVSVEEVAAENNVDADELGKLFGWAAKLWRERLADLFPAPIVEDFWIYPDGNLTIHGHADLVSLVGTEARGMDWKSGFGDADPTAQLRGYAFLALQRWPEAETARMTGLHVRHQRADTLCWTRAELNSWWKWLKSHLVEFDVFRPGEHCSRCPRALECPAHLQTLHALAVVTGIPDPAQLQSAQDAAESLVLVRQVEKRCEEFQKVLKAQVAAQGGEWGPLYLEYRDARSIDFARGRDLCEEFVGATEFANCVKIGKTALEDAVKKDAARGQKGKRVQLLITRLEEAGAIQVTTTQTLKVRREHHGSDRDEASTSPNALCATTSSTEPAFADGDGSGRSGS